jgi:hypothetical protein
MCQPKKEIAPIAQQAMVIPAARKTPIFSRREEDDLNVIGPGNCARVSSVGL